MDELSQSQRDFLKKSMEAIIERRTNSYKNQRDEALSALDDRNEIIREMRLLRRELEQLRQLMVEKAGTD